MVMLHCLGDCMSIIKLKALLCFSLLIFSCIEHESNESNVLRVPRMSESIKMAKENGFFLASYDLTLIDRNDTVKFEKFGWIEKKWIDSRDENNKVIYKALEGKQLVFPYYKAFNSLNKPVLEVEIIDNEWNYLAFSGQTYAYRMSWESLPKEVALFTEHNKKKINELVFTKRDR